MGLLSYTVIGKVVDKKDSSNVIFVDMKTKHGLDRVIFNGNEKINLNDVIRAEIYPVSFF